MEEWNEAQFGLLQVERNEIENEVINQRMIRTLKNGNLIKKKAYWNDFQRGKKERKNCYGKSKGKE